MERDYGGATSPPLSDGESYGSTAPKLSALFAMEQQKLQSGNSSFRYHPPKLPASQSAAAKGVTPVPGFATNMPGPSESYNSAPSLQVLHSVAVLQLLISDSSGVKSFIGNAGMAVLETSSSQTKSYQLVLYDASKRTLANTAMNRDFQCTAKADCWVSFITSSQSWDALFSSTEDWVDFARAVVLTRSLVARVSHSFSDVIIQDISPQQDIPQTGLREGDMVQVTFKAWIERPGFPGTLGHCFQETAGKGKKLEIGSGKAIKGLELGVIGMTKSSRRFFIVPPHLAYASSSERPNRVPDDAVLLFDVTVSRTRRQKGPASEISYVGMENLSDQLSHNGDAGSERDELTAPSFRSNNIHDEMRLVNTVFEDGIEENAQEVKDLTNEKELLIDRMAKLSRIGGAGSYNLPPSSVVAQHKRFTVETPQPSSPSSVAATPKSFIVETSQLSSDSFDHSRDVPNQDSVRDGGSDINDTVKSTSISTVAIEDSVDHAMKLTEEDVCSESENHLPERSDVDYEIQVVSSPKVSQHVHRQQPKLGDAVADLPSRVRGHPGDAENSLISSTAEVPGHIKTSDSCHEPMSTVTSTPLRVPEALGPQSAQTTMPSSSPTLVPQWAQGPPFSCLQFTFPTTTGTLPSNTNAVSSNSVMNPAAQFQPMGSIPFTSTALPGQCTQPYLGHPALVPWFPWGFPHYGPPPYSIPAAESKHGSQQFKILENIRQTQESFAESLRNLTIKFETLHEVCHQRSGPQENEESSRLWSLGLGQGSKGSKFQDQVSSEDGDNQVDNLVESVAVMLAENKELRRRLSEYKNQSPTERGPSVKQSSRLVMSNIEEDKWSEDPGSSSGISQLNMARKKHPHLEFEATTVSSRDLSTGEAERTMVLVNEMKLAMDQIYREVAEELRRSEDVDQSLPVVHKKLMDGVDAIIQILHDKSLFDNPEKKNTSLESPKVKDTHAGSQQQEAAGSPTNAGIETGEGSESHIFKLDEVSLQGL